MVGSKKKCFYISGYVVEELSTLTVNKLQKNLFCVQNVKLVVLIDILKTEDLETCGKYFNYTFNVSIFHSRAENYASA